LRFLEKILKSPLFARKRTKFFRKIILTPVKSYSIIYFMKNPKKRPKWEWRRPGICAPASLWLKFDKWSKKYKNKSDAYRAAIRKAV